MMPASPKPKASLYRLEGTEAEKKAERGRRPLNPVGSEQMSRITNASECLPAKFANVGWSVWGKIEAVGA